MTQKGVHNMNKIIVNMWGGYSSIYRKEASVRFVSDDLERRSEVRRKGVTPYGC